MSFSGSSVKLRDGRSVPVLGLGTYLSSENAVSVALKHGYRLIDTASLYNNEEDVGRAIRSSGIAREEIFVITKLWDSDHGRENTIRAFHESYERLGLEYVDLYLMHSAQGGRTLETWDAMVELRDKGLVKSIGVANFNVHHLRYLAAARPDHIPVVNQIEIHPFLAWDEAVKFCKERSIAVMAYSPLAKALRLKTPTLVTMACKYAKSTTQIMIRWSIQRGFVCIPKSTNKERIRENFAVFDFEISAEDMQTLTALDEHFITDWPGAMLSAWNP